MASPPFSGVGVALVTLFDDEGHLAAEATADLAGQLVALGVRAVVVAGTTGEAATLTPSERAALVRAVRRAIPAGSDVPLLAGTGAPTTEVPVALTHSARDEGADGFLVLSPAGSQDLRGYYEAVAQAASGLPVLGYHFPSVSSPGIPVDELRHLPIDGCKDSTGDAERLLLTLSRWSGPLYTGSSALLALAGAVGCRGAILALANAEPERCIAAFIGEPGAQLEIIEGHLAVGADFPAHIKRLTAKRFGTSATLRPT